MPPDAGWWYLQAGAMAIITGGFLLATLRALLYRSHHPQAPLRDHGLVITVVLLVIAFANVLTAYATAVDWADLRDFGGIVVRMTLILAALYLAALGPLENGRH